MKPQPTNLLNASAPNDGERFEQLLTRPGLHLERICSAPGATTGILQQAHDEWVLLLQGDASLVLGDDELRLGSGDSLLIPADTPHQVTWTSSSPACIWLALHLDRPECTASAS